MMGLVAFRTISQWIHNVQELGSLEANPTPVQ